MLELRVSDANVFVIFLGTRASSRCSKELGERLFKHAWLKVSAVSPLVRIISACLLAALYTPLMSYTMPCCSALGRERPIPFKTEERNTMVLMGTQLRVKNPCIPRRCIGVISSNYTRELPQPYDCCANTLVTL